MVNSYIPDRGDAVYLDLVPQSGHEQGGRRPALVLSPKAYNRKVGLAVFCPITHSIKGYPFEVLIPDGCEISGTVLADQVKSLDWRARRADFKCRLPDEVLEETLEKIRALLFESS